MVGVTKTLGGQPVLQGVALIVPTGKLTTIIGRSSEGKSVLLKHMIGLFQPDSGQVWVDGVEISRLHGHALGFQVLAHVNEKPRISPPHNHGESWAVYGQAIGHTDMTEFRRADDGADAAHAKLEVTRKYRLNPGEVGIYASGAIHSIDYPEGSRFIRITGTNLDRIYRDAFDPATGAIKRMAPQQAS